MYKVLLIMALLGVGSVGYTNPCDKWHSNIEIQQKLPVGNDPNFERIRNQNNQEIIRACQAYQLNLIRVQTANTY